MKLKQILCGVDFSEPSVGAFETAVELAQRFKAELYVLHTIEADPLVPNMALEEKATRAMNALIAPVQEKFPDLHLATEVTTGTAFVEILSRASERHCDLITLGAKGIAMLGERLVGRTSDHVVKEAQCSVLIVRA